MAYNTDLYENVGIETRKLGMWLFIASEIMFFTGLIGAYVVLRHAQPEWPKASAILNIPLAAFNTAALIASGIAFAGSLAAVKKGNQKGLRSGLLLAMFLGSLFLINQTFEFLHLILEKKLTISSSLFGSVFFTLTGFHSAHVLAGLICLFFVFAKSMRGGYSEKEYRGLETAGLYWHFVDAVWIVIFTIVYLI